VQSNGDGRKLFDYANVLSYCNEVIRVSTSEYNVDTMVAVGGSHDEDEDEDDDVLSDVCSAAQR